MSYSELQCVALKINYLSPSNCLGNFSRPFAAILKGYIINNLLWTFLLLKEEYSPRSCDSPSATRHLRSSPGQPFTSVFLLLVHSLSTTHCFCVYYGMFLSHKIRSISDGLLIFIVQWFRNHEEEKDFREQLEDRRQQTAGCVCFSLWKREVLFRSDQYWDKGENALTDVVRKQFGCEC